MNHLARPPYYADAATLPAKIPSEAEILASKNFLKSGHRRSVVRVGSHFVVKYGQDLCDLEAQNMIFVRMQAKIPVPKVYAVFKSVDRKILFIVMENISGCSLETEWLKMSKDQQHQVCHELIRHFARLRHIQSPGYFGCLNRTPLSYSMFYTPERNPDVNGPFSDETALNKALVLRSRMIEIQSGRSGVKADFYQEALPTVFHGNRPVFTHADLQRKNVMVRKVAGTSPPKYQVYLIDWELSGWYPSYWEYCAAAIAFRWDDDWPKRVESILKPYRNEFAWFSMLFNELW